jgi:PIN domain nuclease of toxin-antitoxin system
MRALLDTHTFLWWITDDPRLSPRVRKIIGDGENELFLSAASGWEMAIKAKLGRLQLPDNLERF